ncbi:MAG: hypothetical protein QN168_02390 [Armatimonadota bacterium]|nr:hypothetical protein [Armatimonadota bacterium]
MRKAIAIAFAALLMLSGAPATPSQPAPTVVADHGGGEAFG